MLGRCYSIALQGVDASVVTVEANVGSGLPGVHVVGLADTAVRESRERVRTAALNSGLGWPKTKVVVSLSPANLPKAGSQYDLPMALAILTAATDGAADILSDALVLGELGLDGEVRPVPGIVPSLVAARRHGVRTVVIPPGNAAEAMFVPDVEVVVAHTLVDAVRWATSAEPLPLARGATQMEGERPQVGDFADIAGQEEAKRAAEVAAAGGHHLLMIGPPGSGKSMLAARIPGILPPLSPEQAMEATAVASVADKPGDVVTHPPFVAPHASVTRAALLGGGPGNPRPGAVSLAHHGVLFLDEASEISAAVLDGLRAPLEEGKVRLVRHRREVVFPARFQLVLAANPCRCAADNPGECRCKGRERADYLKNLSGPLRDRLDMQIRLSGQAAVLHSDGEEPSAVIAERVLAARAYARERWSAAGYAAVTNAAMPAPRLRREFPADEVGMAMLGSHLAAGELSQRGVDKALTLAWTIRDLEAARDPWTAATAPNIDHVAQALELREEAA